MVSNAFFDLGLRRKLERCDGDCNSIELMGLDEDLLLVLFPLGDWDRRSLTESLGTLALRRKAIVSPSDKLHKYS